MTLAACGDPLAGVDRLTDVDVSEDATAAALPDAQEVAREGFLGTEAAEGDVPAQVAEEPKSKETGGFFSGLVKRVANSDAAAAVAADVAASQSEPVVIETTPVESASAIELAALPAEPATPPVDEPEKKRGIGLFGGATKKDKPRTGPDARDVPLGTVLAFGEIARVCEAKGKSLGKKLDGSGRRGFALYDSNPSVRDKRTFYITGFGDNCPRQFTAANALFGKPSFYEQIRFSPAGKHLPYAKTDEAYDKVKSKVCRARKKEPCGVKIDKLDGLAAFVSAYEFHEHNGKWKEFLVHDGEVVASAVKSVN
ncbi:DNA polymerase III subunit alpha [Sulfitobacter donghicola DSW-25 = KCTC 12864 = JCM 14565]|nr:DNA polymerase III subunit alpha [Sulfitobacter donghicola DSW-25 = KCTC 12864 = JCM 14565]